MNEIAEIKKIERKIYNIRGVEVMLDSDLAEKIQEAFNKPAPAASAIPQKYSFKNTTDIIINIFINLINMLTKQYLFKK